jgi:hypothetical protein
VEELLLPVNVSFPSRNRPLHPAKQLLAATPPPDSSNRFERMPYHQPYSNGPTFLKPGRVMPPKVDTSAAST